jgi:hypothetical protein
MLPGRGRVRVPALAAVVAVAFAYAASVLLSLPDRMAAGDSAYHFAMAERIWHGEIVPDLRASFPWTVFADMNVDHYWGFHVMTSPFALVASPEIGMKLAAATLFALLLGTLYAVLVRHRAPYAWVWTFASVLFSSQDWRYLQLRGGAPMASLLLVLVEIAFFVERRRARVAALVGVSWFAMLVYQGAIVLLPFHVAGVIGLALATRGPRRFERAVEPAFTAVGLLLGTIVNPYVDRRLSPLRFAVFHAVHGTGDPAGLFAGNENAELFPFPVRALVTDWGWSVLGALVLAGLGWVIARRAKGHTVRTDVVVYAAMTAAGVVLMARAIRLREYSVPIAFAFLGMVLRDAVTWRPPRWVALVAGAVLTACAYPQAKRSQHIIETVSKPLGLYAGARDVLRAHAGQPVANVVQGDSTFLMWEWPTVQVAQLLNPYFIYFHDRALYDDLQALRHPKSDGAVVDAVRRLAARGVELVAARDSIEFHAVAARHPEALRRAYTNARYGAVLYEIVRP